MRVGSRQIQIARAVNFLNFMQDEYPTMIEYSHKWKAYIHPDHDSLKFFEHGYFQFSTSKGGDGITFLQEWCGLPFQDAVIQLYRYAGVHEDTTTYTRKNTEYKPPAATTKGYKRIFAYLTINRRLDSDTVKELIDKKLVYEDARSNVVFINDTPGNRIAIARGTLTYGEMPVYKRIYTEQSNNYWVLQQDEDIKTVFVTESPIDAVSMYELSKKTNAAYVAMAGLKPATLQRIIKDYPNAEIWIATDWDDAGKKFAVRQSKELGLKIVSPSKEYREVTKDWNEYLKIKKGESHEQS